MWLASSREVILWLPKMPANGERSFSFGISKNGFESRWDDDKVKSLEMTHKAEAQEFAKRKALCAWNAIKAHTLLMQQCTEKMESQLENRDDFSTKLKDDPIEMTKATKEETHHFRANAHDMAMATKVAKDLLNMKQGLCESLSDWQLKESDIRPREIPSPKDSVFLACDNMTSFDTLYRFTSTSTSQPLTLPRPLGLVFVRLRLTSQVTDVRWTFR